MSACPPLRTVWRPGFARWTAVGVALFATVTLIGIAVLLPIPWSDRIYWLDRALLVALGLFAGWFIGRFARVRVAADDTGILVVNAFRRHRLEWAQVVGVRLGSGDPWVQLDLSDGTVLAAMAMQTADGERGRRMAAELASCVAQRAGREPGSRELSE